MYTSLSDGNCRWRDKHPKYEQNAIFATFREVKIEKDFEAVFFALPIYLVVHQWSA